MDFDWSEDPLPVPSEPMTDVRVGDAVYYITGPKGQRRRQFGKVKQFGEGGEYAFVAGHGEPFDVQIVLTKKLKFAC